jgi:NADP-dependent aldehyde dehydrogenase
MARAYSPVSGEQVGRDYPDATITEVSGAAARALESASVLRALTPSALRSLLLAVADHLDDASAELVEIADQETGLGRVRLEGEVARTSGQFRLVADLVAAGRQLDAVISTRLTGPAKDLRRVNRPIGVVGIFPASNFPFAFGVLGTDTAAALAAQCPVLIKASPGYPGTSERTLDVARRALLDQSLPAEAIQLLHGASHELGGAVVTADDVAAIAFTGSTVGGRALSDLAASRARPIPVYAEQGSRNPTILAPSAFREPGAAALAATFAASLTNGWGQFCTKPGVIIVPTHHEHEFSEALIAELARVVPAHLLSEPIARHYDQALTVRRDLAGVDLWEGTRASDGFAVPAVVARVDAGRFIGDAPLQDEMFGPACVVVSAADVAELSAIQNALGGNLTTTLYGEPGDPWIHGSIDLAAQLSGRVVFGGVPTGVAVDPAMHHGGPYPASSSAMFTSVGTGAVRRFLVPTAFQDMPDELLPPSLQDANPWGIERRVNGVLQVGTGTSV